MKIIFLISFVILVIYVIFYLIYSRDKQIKKPIENFQEKPKQDNIIITGPSLIDDSSIKIFGENDPITCNLKISKEQFCYDIENQKKWNRQLIPVHIIQDFKGKYLAVFNDGQIYTKDNLIDKKLWIGPLNNSYALNSEGLEIPLRMIMLYPFEKEKNGDEIQYKVIKLLGVGIDGNLYLKEGEDYQSKWNNVSGGNNQNLIYIFTDFLESKEQSNLKNTETELFNDVQESQNTDYYPRLWAIDGNGRFLRKINNSLESSFEVFSHTQEPVPMIKVFWDKNGFMLGIGTDFKIYKKKSTQWKTLQAWDLDNGPSEYKVIDLLLDSDGHFFGVVLDNELGRIRLMKQTEFYYLANFEFLELTNRHKPNILSIYNIIHHKSGFDIQTYNSYIDLEEEMYRNENLEAIHQRNMLENRMKLQKLCKKKNPEKNLTARNFEFENQLNEQKNKIDELSKEIIRLSHPDFSKISKVSPQGDTIMI